MRSPRRKAKESLSINLIMATKHAHTPGVQEWLQLRCESQEALSKKER